MTDLLPGPAPSVQQAIDFIATQFEAADLHYGHGTDCAWDEAVYLVLAVADLPDDEAVLQQPLPTPHWRKVQQLAAARITQRTPLAYLLGRAQYAGVWFRIAPGVLIPRSPLGPWLQQHAGNWLPQAPRRILDIGTGSGCLGILAALQYPNAELVLTDIDHNALLLARANVSDHGLAERTHLLQGSGVAALAAAGTFDLVLCNPPYVNATDMAALPAEYQHEPALALAAGDDGLAVMSPILARLPELLSSQGLFLGEVGLSEAALRRAHPGYPFTWLSFEQGGEGVFAVLAQPSGSNA